MGQAGPRSVVLDAGALIAIERGDPRIRALLDLAARSSIPTYIPATAIAEVWRGGEARQARLSAALSAGLRHNRLHVIPLDFEAAKQVGVLIARTNTSHLGVADATVAWCALRMNGVVYTTDPRDIARLLPPDRVQAI